MAVSAIVNRWNLPDEMSVRYIINDKIIVFVSQYFTLAEVHIYNERGINRERRYIREILSCILLEPVICNILKSI
jgi:hypothetical protein